MSLRLSWPGTLRQSCFLPLAQVESKNGSWPRVPPSQACGTFVRDASNRGYPELARQGMRCPRRVEHEVGRRLTDRPMLR